MACLGRKAFSSASKIQTLVTHRIHAPGEFTVTILSPSQRSLNLSMGHLTIPNWSQKNCPKAPKQKQQQQQQQQQHLFELSTLPRPLVCCIHVPPLQVVLQAGFFCLEHRDQGFFGTGGQRLGISTWLCQVLVNVATSMWSTVVTLRLETQR